MKVYVSVTGKKVKAKGKGKTVSLNDFLAEGGASVSIPPPVNWADVTEDLESDSEFMLSVFPFSYKYCSLCWSL